MRHVLVAAAAVALAGLLPAAPAAASGQGGFVPAPGSPYSAPSSTDELAFSPDGKLLALADGDVLAYAVGADGRLARVPGSQRRATAGWASSVAFSPDGRLLAASALRAASVVIFSVGPGGQLTESPRSPLVTGSDLFAAPTGVAFSPDGRFLAVTILGDKEGSVHLYAVGADGGLTGAGATSTPGEAEAPPVFSPDGKLLAVTSGACSVSVFSVSHGGALAPVAGSPYHTFPDASSPSCQRAYVRGVAFNPQGTLLAAVDSGEVAVFSVGAGRLAAVSGSPFHEERASAGYPASVAFAPSGRLLAATGTSGVAIFSVARDGQLTQTQTLLKHGCGSDTVAFSPSGALAVGLDACPRDGGVAVFAAAGNGTPATLVPTVRIAAPADGGTYSFGDVVPTSFACAEGPGGPGLARCVDSRGASSPAGRLDTWTVGEHSYSVTATSRDGRAATATIHYTVGWQGSCGNGRSLDQADAAAGTRLADAFKVDDGEANQLTLIDESHSPSFLVGFFDRLDRDKLYGLLQHYSVFSHTGRLADALNRYFYAELETALSTCRTSRGLSDRLFWAAQSDDLLGERMFTVLSQDTSASEGLIDPLGVTLLDQVAPLGWDSTQTFGLVAADALSLDIGSLLPPPQGPWGRATFSRTVAVELAFLATQTVEGEAIVEDAAARFVEQQLPPIMQTASLLTDTYDLWAERAAATYFQIELPVSLLVRAGAKQTSIKHLDLSEGWQDAHDWIGGAKDAALNEKVALAIASGDQSADLLETNDGPGTAPALTMTAILVEWLKSSRDRPSQAQLNCAASDFLFMLESGGNRYWTVDSMLVVALEDGKRVIDPSSANIDTFLADPTGASSGVGWFVPRQAASYEWAQLLTPIFDTGCGLRLAPPPRPAVVLNG